jgi:hypothetical protein
MPVVVESVSVEIPLGSRPEPEIIVDFPEIFASRRVIQRCGANGHTVLSAFGDRTVRIPADVVTRLVAEALGHIYVTELAFVEEFHGLSHILAGAVLEADADEAIILVGGFDHFAAFPDIV